MAQTTLYPRFLTPHLLESLEDSPATLIQGPRQCGKTLLALMSCAPHLLHRETLLPEYLKSLSLPSDSRKYGYFTFDDEAALNNARYDPKGFVANLPECVILDEVQRAPWLFRTLKMEIDRRRIPGRFLLTGSAHVLSTAHLSDSLAGRMQILHLHPLAQCELEQSKPDFLASLFNNNFKPGRVKRLGNQLAERVAAGGYPEALERSAGRRRSNWHQSYLDALVQRDVQEMARIGMIDVLPRLLESAATQTARLLNANKLAARLEMNRNTIRSYIALLERVFLLDRLRPWRNNRLSRLVKTPKLHLGDTGLACALLGVDAMTLVKDRLLLGQLLETFVFQELKKQAGWNDALMSFLHFRDRDGAEVDIVIERGPNAVTGVEVKASSAVSPADFRGLHKLAQAAGNRFACGVVLYDGETVIRFADRLCAVPIRRLWESP